MGFLDALKKLVPKSEPMPWDVQTIRHHQFSLRLPEGWRFTRADWGRAAAIGPADQEVELFYSVRTQPELTSQDAPKLLDLMRMLVRHDAGLITCREALKHFGTHGGSIINIGSMSSERFSAGAVAYTATKAGVTGVSAGGGACLTRDPGQSNQPRCRGHRRRTGDRCNE